MKAFYLSHILPLKMRPGNYNTMYVDTTEVPNKESTTVFYGVINFIFYISLYSRAWLLSRLWILLQLLLSQANDIWEERLSLFLSGDIYRRVKVKEKIYCLKILWMHYYLHLCTVLNNWILISHKITYKHCIWLLWWIKSVQACHTNTLKHFIRHQPTFCVLQLRADTAWLLWAFEQGDVSESSSPHNLASLTNFMSLANRLYQHLFRIQVVFIRKVLVSLKEHLN